MQSPLVVILLLSALITLCSSADPTYIIDTNDGPVKGNVHPNGVISFHGIPFAEKPIDSLRFRAPIPLVNSWTNPLDCTDPVSVNMCPQARLDLFQIVGTEDCLYLDVYLPPNATTASDPLPVMFWIYGGGFVFGDRFELGLYDGINLALKRNVIIVAANYRLNVFGFLASRVLQSQDPNNSTGNMGLLDQRLAMVWTQNNIRHFNGDPSKVTIFGESAGAFSVCFHLTSPASRGLFSAAIMESGTCSSPFFFTTIDYAEDFGNTFTSAFGCNLTAMTGEQYLKCLRETPARDILTGLLSWFGPNWPNHINWPPVKGFGSEGLGLKELPVLAPVMPWGPVIDGSNVGLPDLPYTMITQGNFAKVPLITGSNANEGVIFVPLVPLVDKGTIYPLDEAGFESILSHFFNDTVKDQVMVVYPRNEYLDNDQRANRVLTDFFFSCDARRVARSFSDQGITSHLYQYVYKNNWIDGRLLGDYHSSELFFVWDNQWPAVVHHFDEKDTIMAETFNVYWTNMPKVGSPNASWNNATTNPQWPVYTRANDIHLALNVPPAVGTALLTEKCDFWDTLV